MIGCVAGAVEGTKGRSLSSEDLSISDWVLTLGGTVLVDFGIGAEGEEVFNAANVVGVPVCQESVGDGGLFGG